MDLNLIRDTLTEQSTEGEIYIGSTPECVTLELPNKDGKPGSCIPQGTYEITLKPSAKFENSTDPWVRQYAKEIPHLEDKFGRTTILIHWGNDATDTQGCILVGTGRGNNHIDHSRIAFASLHKYLKAATAAGERIHITVLGGAMPQ